MLMHESAQLRIWGGGIYQPSASTPGVYDFYDICDELGILAWSELIFSDTLYPINDFLLQSIEPEVRQNVRRVKRNPSNAQWAGGNEIEGIVISANQTLANGTHYLDEVRLSRTLQIARHSEHVLVRLAVPRLSTRHRLLGDAICEQE